MLDPYAHGESLGRHLHATLLQHAEGIPGTVADTQEKGVGLDLLLCGSIRDGRPEQCLIHRLQIQQAGPETDRTA